MREDGRPDRLDKIVFKFKSKGKDLHGQIMAGPFSGGAARDLVLYYVVTPDGEEILVPEKGIVSLLPQEDL